jgi:secondary thiamine-phosphate synthase enzyme
MVEISITTSRRTELCPRRGRSRPRSTALPAWDGLLHVHSPHTTAGVTVNEQADPDVAADLEKALAKLVPWNAGYAHAEGNSAAHIQTALVGTSAWCRCARAAGDGHVAGDLPVRIRRTAHARAVADAGQGGMMRVQGQGSGFRVQGTVGFNPEPWREVGICVAGRRGAGAGGVRSGRRRRSTGRGWPALRKGGWPKARRGWSLRWSASRRGLRRRGAELAGAGEPGGWGCGPKPRPTSRGRPS